MTGTTFWLGLACGELVLIALVVLLVARLRERSARARDREAIATLVGKIKAGKAGRVAAVRNLLSRHFGLSGDELEGATLAVARAELELYQAFANLYLRRDHAAAAAFDRVVESAVSPYWTLQGGAPAEGEGDAGEIARLQGENRRLAEELQITMDTMSRMLSEYAAVFAGEDGEDGPAVPLSAATVDEPGVDAALSSEPVSPADRVPRPRGVAVSAGEALRTEVDGDSAFGPAAAEAVTEKGADEDKAIAI
jgi:hypothetical protein